MIQFENIKFRYDPFPLGVVSGVFNEADYRELTQTYPTPELFSLDAPLGHRYTLAANTHPRAYRAHFAQHQIWRELSRLTSSSTFLTTVLETLLAHHVDLGVSPRPTPHSHYLWRLVRALKQGHAFALRRRPQTQMIFAMLPADGGSLRPHTDSPLKLLNMAITMSPQGEWNPDFGGGTDINRPKDPRRWFNRTNQRLNFEDVERLDTVPFLPNQSLLVIRSDNSWHSIRPMTGVGSPLMRKTLNINLLGGGP